MNVQSMIPAGIVLAANASYLRTRIHRHRCMSVFLGVSELYYPTNAAVSTADEKFDVARLICIMPPISVSWHYCATTDLITYRAEMIDLAGEPISYSETYEF